MEIFELQGGTYRDTCDDRDLGLINRIVLDAPPIGAIKLQSGVQQ
jgi:hypothetical protein